MTTITPVRVVVCGAGGEMPPELGAEVTIRRETERAGYVARLADEHAGVIVVWADSEPGWRWWVTTAKSSPATRRIPVVCISGSAEARAGALLAGADFTLSPAQAGRELARLIREHGRGIDPEVVAALACACNDPLPQAAREAIALFNAGEYYRQHDLLEALWVETESPVRDLYRAILQVGIAYYQITQGNYRGALKMFLRSVQWLNILPDACQGVDVAALKADAYRARAELERLGEARIGEFDRALIQPVKWVV